MGNQFQWQATNASRAQGDWERDLLDEPIGHSNGKTTSILVSLHYVACMHACMATDEKGVQKKQNELN